nr:Flp family type IVb pilin [uncultured Rhodopila sp.]
MFKSVKRIRAFWSDRSGVTAVEYGLIAAVMAGVIVAILATLNTSLNSTMTNIGTTLTTNSAPVTK